MAEDDRDALMKIVLGQVPIDAECQAIVSKNDDLAYGFVSNMPATGGGTRPNYFSIGDFTFQVALSGDTSAVKLAQAGKANTEQQMKELAKSLQDKMPELAGMKLGGGTKDSSEFARFMSNGRGAMRSRTYPADLEPITITKELDSSSLTLLKSCINSVTFKTATLLKRKATGERELRTYMRIDFNDVLITEFNWDEDEVVKERFKFVCREAIVQYAIEEDSGKLRKQGTRKWSVLNLGT